ncbi:MAG: tRNA (adenine(22)-N(1))-methyltransferase [Anaerovoracaceae bacterium]|jgi:tRNA (adenine22-N1)-methyltransferase
MIKLSERLKTIADCIHKGESIADIGTDHGLLPIFLYQQGISDKIIMSDIKEGPLEKARNNLESFAPKMNADIRLGSGLNPISMNEVDNIIIAGMGGVLITQILEENLEKTVGFKKYILQPRTGQDKLREWLFLNGFAIIDEYLVREGHHLCEIIVTVPNPNIQLKEEDRKALLTKMRSDLFFEISPLLLYKKDPLLQDFIERKIHKDQKIISEILVNGNENNNDKVIESKKRINKLQLLLEQVKKDT